MKKIIVFFLVTLSSAVASAQAENPPVDISKAIRHANPMMAPTHDRLLFLSTLSGSKIFSEGFAEDVLAAAKKDSIVLTYTYRGNMIEFKTANLWPLGFMCQLFLTPQQGEGIMHFYYSYKGKTIFTDAWLYMPPFSNQVNFPNVTKETHDKMDSFCHYSEMAALMVKHDLYLSDILYSRLQNDFFDSSVYLMEFRAAFSDCKLEIRNMPRDVFTVDNCNRVYIFNEKTNHRQPMPYEKSEKW